MSDLHKILKEEYEKKMTITPNLIIEMIEEMMEQVSESVETIEEEEGSPGGRFSFSIPIPKLVPTEAWGDPSSQSRAAIARIFDSITREPDIRARIQHVNSFLLPEQALRKAPGGKINAVLNMMQIIEALQACLNDYNESSAGFVFEGFMAALTGGKQIAGRVGGTLPIEDFVAFSETGDTEVPTSLKLLSPNTTIHGSFTNLVDYLFIRGGTGVPEIRYLIALKDVEEDNVSKLAFFDFVISRDNFIEVMLQSNNGGLLGQSAAALKKHIATWTDPKADPGPIWRLKMRDLLRSAPGYTANRGMFYVNLDDEGNFSESAGPITDPDKKRAQYGLATAQGEMTALLNAAQQAGAAFARGEGAGLEDWIENLDLDMEGFTKAKRKKTIQAIADAFEEGAQAAQPEAVTESYYGFGPFHEREKLLMKEELLSEGSSTGGSQWGISRGNMNKMRSLISTEYYGELDLSQANIDELSKIYIDKLGEDLMSLLEVTKNFSENIGRYFSTPDRAEAIQANQQAIAQGGQIITSLASDPAGASEET